MIRVIIKIKLNYLVLNFMRHILIIALGADE